MRSVLFLKHQNNSSCFRVGATYQLVFSRYSSFFFLFLSINFTDFEMNNMASRRSSPDNGETSAFDTANEEDCDLSDAIWGYMNQFLMEETVQDIGCVLKDSLNLRMPTAPGVENPAAGIDFGPVSDLANDEAMLSYVTQILMEEDSEDTGFLVQGSLSLKLQEAERSLYEAIGNKYPPSPAHAPASTSLDGSESVSSFIKGVEEASKLIPNIEDFIKGKKHGRGSSEEGRSRKQANTYAGPAPHSHMFDEILLHHAGDRNKALVSFRESLQSKTHPKARQEASVAVDLRRLLISCAEAVAADAKRAAQVILSQIRLHSSPLGDGIQRLAHYFANGLEARLAGTGTHIYWSLSCKRPSAITMLKAYQLYLAACPFTAVSYSFSNITIWERTRGAPRIHIIDFGILYGFQWPTFLQQISKLPDGPPRVRITGIEFPQPGFRPAERVEETGRRLVHYAKEFNVPFEFNSIAKRWEAVKVEDLKLDENEVVVVNCIYRMKNLPDETTMVLDCSSSRSAVLSMIRRTNPVVFIQGVVNGGYNAPSFLTRFREALFHFSTQFDMLDSIVPRECEDRVMLEGEVLGREAFNVMACEGWDRVERPETYRQWHTRTCQAGFAQLPIGPVIKERARFKVSAYCKEFVIDQDGQWLVLGWKGKILYALSTWKPA